MFKFLNRNVIIFLVLGIIVVLGMLVWGIFNSINTFKPVPSQEKIFEIVEKEDPNITTIRKYYFEIEKGNLENAYNMYQNKNVSFETYKEWYKNTIMVNPIDFEKLTDKRYQFKVELQDNNQNQELYRVIMEVNEGKIIPISSEEIVAGPISFGNVTAFVIQKRLGIYEFKTHLILSKNGKEQVLDEELSNDGAGKRFVGPLEFSPDGNYLISPVAGYEWRGTNIYDIKNKKRVLELGMSLKETNFTSNEKYFFAWAESGLDGVYSGIIYSLPDFEEIYNDMIGAELYNSNVSCEYDKNEQVIRFNIDSDPKIGETKRQSRIVEFSEITGKIEVISD